MLLRWRNRLDSPHRWLPPEFRSFDLGEYNQRSRHSGLLGRQAYLSKCSIQRGPRLDDEVHHVGIPTVPHVAFEVDDLAEAIRDQTVIVAPNSPSAGVLVAMIEVNGAPVELMQIDHLVRKDL